MIKQIELNNFRNFDKVSFDTNCRLVIFQGRNATGKTSILEAIYLVSTSKSHRTQDLSLLLKDECQYGWCNITAFKQYKVVLSKDKRTFFINKMQVKKVSDFVGKLRVTMFSPLDINLVNGSRSIRRHMLDLEISLLDSKYLNLLSNYKKILSERNNFLKSKNIDKAYLETIDITLTNLIDGIYKRRVQFLDSINKRLEEISKGLELPKVYLEYKSSFNPSDIKKSLKEKMQYDILTKTTNIGVHRDDFIIKIGNYVAVDYASEGQRRLISIAIKLAIKEEIEEITKEDVILLLDDVFASLDIKHIELLIKEVLKSKQVFITTTSILEIPDYLLEKSLVIKI